MPTRTPYTTDLSDDEWRILEPLVPVAKLGGGPRSHETCELLNAIFYVLRRGCAWRIDGTWERIHTILRETFLDTL